MDKAGIVEIADVAGAEIFLAAYGDESFFGFGRIAKIALHHADAADDDFTILSELGGLLSFEIHNDNVVVR